MAVNDTENLEKLVDVIREVKPSLVSTPIALEDSLVENLGLDSLDITQLARKVRRVFGGRFDPQGWAALNPQHRYSVKSLLDAAVRANSEAGPENTTGLSSSKPAESVTG